MKCIVKGCENGTFKQDLCEEHYDAGKQSGKEGEPARSAASVAAGIGRQTSFVLHTALLLSGKIAGKLVRGYSNVFSLTPKERAQILDYLATNDLKKGRKERSLAAFERAVKIDPENPESHLKLGEFYLASDQFEKACECFERALELDPEAVHVCEALGEAYYNREDFKSAKKYLAKGHALSPDSEKLNYFMGLTHDKLGSFENAVKFLQAAVDLNPRKVEYYYSLGFVYESKGKKDEALQNFKKAVELERSKAE